MMAASMSPKKACTFLIDEDLAKALKALKARDGAPEGEIIRRALAEYLKRKGVFGRDKAARPRARTRGRA
jgi:predicted transcriptional regulator